MIASNPHDVMYELYGPHITPYFVRYIFGEDLRELTDNPAILRAEIWSTPEGEEDCIYLNSVTEEWGDYSALSQWADPSNEEDEYYEWDGGYEDDIVDEYEEEKWEI